MRSHLLIAAISLLGVSASPLYAQCNLTTMYQSSQSMSAGSACYFDLTAVSTTTLSGLAINTNEPTGTPVTIQLYTRSGSYVNAMRSSSGWNLVATGSGISVNADLPTVCNLSAPITLPIGLTGICVHYTNCIQNLSIPNQGSLNYSNASVSIACGAVATAPFNGFWYSNRIWNGSLFCSRVGITPEFSAGPLNGPTPLQVSFTDQSSTTDPAGLQTWAWDFDGDRIVDSNLRNPSFTYVNCGRFDVTLTLTDTRNPSAALTKSSYVFAGTMQASFSVAGTGARVFQFTDTSTGPATSWSWDLDGDQIPDSTAQNPRFTYPGPGQYTVTLTASNACDQSTATQTVQVSSAANDFCVGAQALVLGVSGPYSNGGASSEPIWRCANAGNEIWFRYRMPCTADFEISTCSSPAPSFDTVIAVFTGACGTLQELACNDDSCNLLSSVTIPGVSSGTLLYIAVGGYAGAQGSFSLDLRLTPSGTGSFNTLSPGCGGTTLTASGNPNGGGSVSFTLSPVLGFPFVNLGRSPLGIPLCGSCILGATLDVTFPTAQITGAIPCDPLFIGGTLYAQGIDLGVAGGCAASEPLQLTLSETIRMTIG